MATSLSPNPLTYVHPGASTIRNGWYGPDVYHRLNCYRNTTSWSGGNPWVLFRHEGSWLFFDKTTDAESPVRVPLILIACLLNPAYGNTAPPFTVFSYSTRQIRHQGVSGYLPARPYEPIIGPEAAGVAGSGPISTPAFGRAYVDDMQRAVQHIKDNASLYGVDPTRGNLWGISAGSSGSGAAAFSPTRAYSSQGLVPNMPMSDSYVRSWLNWIGPIDFNPSYVSIDSTYPLFGIVDSDAARRLADGQAQLNQPGTTNPNSLCRSISPRLLASTADLTARKTRVFSVYDRNNAAGSNPFTDPHDWRQSADLQAACAVLGISYEALLPHLVTDFAGDRQLMWESTVDAAYDFLVASNT